MSKRAKITVDGKSYDSVEATPKNAYFVPLGSNSAKKTLLGFSTRSTLQKWAKQNGFATAFDDLERLLSRFKRQHPHEPSTAAQQRLKREQSQLLQAKRQRFLSAARQYKVSVRDPKALTELAENYPPLEGPPFHSCILFRYADYSGSFLYLPSGIVYPNLSWFGFDNRASSFIQWSATTVLYQFHWFSGRTMWIVGGLSGNLEDWDFDNRTSSVITI